MASTPFRFKQCRKLALTATLWIHLIIAPQAAQGQGAGQLGFTDLQAQAGNLVDQGDLVGAQPLLLELVKRVTASNDTTVELDFPYFLIGTGYVQRYLSSGENSHLNEALRWYDRLQKEYPESKHVKNSQLKRVDILRALNRQDEAIALLKNLITGPFQNQFSYSERLKLLKDLTQTYYSSSDLVEGLAFFYMLREFARDSESKALASAAAFEALVSEDRFDDALRVLPDLVVESEARYHPRFNVSLLMASDKLVELERLNDVTLLLSLTKTTDQMIRYYENRLRLDQDLLERSRVMSSGDDRVDLEQKIATTRERISKLRELPTLKNELTVRRARNYVKTDRIYEAFWMFYELLVENPNDPQSEFFHYAVFSNAISLEKHDFVRSVGEQYREKFPTGTYYNDVTAALAINLKATGNNAEFKSVVEDYLDSRPMDPNARVLFAQWALFHIEQQRFNELIQICNRWQAMHAQSVFGDGLDYWKGLAYLMANDFPQSIDALSSMLKKYPTSGYAEEALLRKGFAEFYDRRFKEAHQTISSFLTKYQYSPALDQAYYILGEIEGLDGNIDQALTYYRKAEELANGQDIIDSVTFRIGGIYELKKDYESMAQIFEQYIETYGEKAKRTDAALQLGRAYENQLKVIDMLHLYRKYIEEFYMSADDPGVDALIEAYSEKYTQSLTKLRSTVEMLDQLENDAEFRKKMVTDRGFLFEYFYTNSDVDQSLYNKMRFHPNFKIGLLEDLSPLDSLFSPYRQQLAGYPSQGPVELFQNLRLAATEANERVGETRMLMGLYRQGIIEDPSRPFDGELIQKLQPRLLLYVADYMRKIDINYSVNVWNKVIEDFPQTDSVIVAYIRLADNSRTNGDLMASFSYLKEIVDNFPGSPKLPNVLLTQGEIMTELSRTSEARDIYQYILRVQEWRGIVHARALYQIALSYMQEEEWAKAHGFFERTFLGYAHYSDYAAKAYFSDAEALMQMGEAQDAIRTLNEAIETLTLPKEDEMIQAIVSKRDELKRRFPQPTTTATP